MHLSESDRCECFLEFEKPSFGVMACQSSGKRAPSELPKCWKVAAISMGIHLGILWASWGILPHFLGILVSGAFNHYSKT